MESLKERNLSSTKTIEELEDKIVKLNKEMKEKSKAQKYCRLQRIGIEINLVRD